MVLINTLESPIYHSLRYGPTDAMALGTQQEFVFVNFLPIFEKNFVSSKKVRNIVL